MVSPTGTALVTLVAVVLSVVWYYGGHERWRSLTADRFLYGIPWGTLLTVALVVAFYLFAQQGISHWDEPLTLPFVSWSYFYPLGVLTSGFAHSSPAHLTSNLGGTLVFGVVAEYAWGHYPPTRRDRTTLLAGDGGRLSQPWVRAFVVVPGAMFGAALLTAVFSLGPAVGFSGAVFAVAGFAVVTRPLSGVVAVVTGNALGTLYDGITSPVVRGAVESGPPAPPSWASIAFQAHLLGFVIGAGLGVGLLWSRRQRHSPVRLFAGLGLFGLAQSLWLVALPVSTDAFVLFRGIGIAVVVVLSSLLTVAVAGSDRTVPRSLAALWLAILALPLGLVGLFLVAILLGQVSGIAGGTAVVLGILALLALALPAAPSALEIGDERLRTHRGTALLCLGTVAALLALPAVLYSPVVVDTGSVTDTGEVTVGDYLVTYGENVTGGQELVLLDTGNATMPGETYDGLIVTNERRALWTVAESDERLAYSGTATVQVGGVGWRETVRAERTGWDVTGNGSAYAVDLTHDGETTRSFTTDPVRADVRVDDHDIAVVPAEDAFTVRATRNRSAVGTVAVPTGNETVSLGPLRVLTERDGDTTELVVESDGSRVTVAQKETY